MPTQFPGDRYPGENFFKGPAESSLTHVPFGHVISDADFFWRLFAAEAIDPRYAGLQ